MTNEEWFRYLSGNRENNKERWEAVFKFGVAHANNSKAKTYSEFLSELPPEEQEELYAKLMIEFG